MAKAIGFIWPLVLAVAMAWIWWHDVLLADVPFMHKLHIVATLLLPALTFYWAGLEHGLAWRSKGKSK